MDVCFLEGEVLDSSLIMDKKAFGFPLPCGSNWGVGVTLGGGMDLTPGTVSVALVSGPEEMSPIMVGLGGGGVFC